MRFGAASARRLLSRGKKGGHQQQQQQQHQQQQHQHQQQEGGEEEEEMAGIRYNFTLRDTPLELNEENDNDGGGSGGGGGAAVAAPEWLVPTPLLEKVAARHGLKLVKRENFHRFALDALKKREDLDTFQRMRVANAEGSMSAAEWAIAQLYQCLVFERVPEGGAAVAAASASGGQKKKKKKKKEEEEKEKKRGKKEGKNQAMLRCLVAAQSAHGAAWKTMSRADKDAAVKVLMKKEGF